MKAFLLFVAIFTLVTLSNCITPPKIPQTFSTSWIFSVSPFFENADIIEGFLAVNYPKNQGYVEYQDPGRTPYQLQSSLIGHPLNKTFIQGYSFLNYGRCWTIPEGLSPAQFQYFPLEVPATAVLTTNYTDSNGDLIGLWSWGYNVYIFELNIQMAVRWRDGAVIEYSIQNSNFFYFIAVWTSSGFNTTAPPSSLFEKPPGPCPFPTTGGPISSHPMLHLLDDQYNDDLDDVVSKDVQNTYLYRVVKSILKKQNLKTPFIENNKFVNDNLLAVKYLSHLQNDKADRVVNKMSDNTPIPPTVQPYFTADYSIGYGSLNSSNKFMGLAPFQVGFLAVDSETAGFYINCHDDQDSNVPWELNFNAIATPNPNNLSTLYLYLLPGRCWNIGPSAGIRADEFGIPSNAVFNGTVTYDGVMVDLWQWNGVVQGFEGNVLAATSRAGSNVKLYFLSVDYLLNDSYGGYIKFRNFNPSKPSTKFYAAPPGYCPTLFPQ